MRILILFIIIFTLSNCTEKKTSVKPPIEYYFIENHRHFIGQSTYAEIAEHINRIMGDYELVYKNELEFNKKTFTIKKFSNIKTADIDGEDEIFYLDSLLIYQRSVNWVDAYRVLQSNNDSINKIVSFSLASILGNPGMFYPEHTQLQFEELNELRKMKK